jgi:fructose-1,6-bisphosphatase
MRKLRSYTLQAANSSRFTMYGASAQLVITMKGGTVNGFTMVSEHPPG